MLQINNNEAKSEWNFNGTHINPMINGRVTHSDTDTVTLNTLETGDYTLLPNAVGHNFVIGVDKNLLDTSNCRSDIVIIQSSGMKLLSSNDDLKNPDSPPLSYVDLDKSETTWENPVLKDDTVSNDQANFEVKYVLNYNDPAHEMEKTEYQINMDTDIASQGARDNEIFTGESVEEENEKHCEYFIEAPNNESVQHFDDSNSVEILNLDNNVKLYECKSQYEEENTQGGMQCDEVIPVQLGGLQIQNDTNQIPVNRREEHKNYLEIIDSLHEKSLPLKKKAKMKQSFSSNSENQVSLSEQNVHVNELITLEPPKKLLPTPNAFEEQTHQWTSEQNLQNIPNSQLQELSTEPQQSTPEFTVSAVQQPFNWNPRDKPTMNDFRNAYDLTDYLRKCRLINTTVLDTLNCGLKELKTDLLKEMKLKRKRSSREKSKFSPQLKAFALVLYFKHPAAFNHLSEIFKEGWPSLDTVKEWKCQMNRYQKQSTTNTRDDSDDYDE